MVIVMKKDKILAMLLSSAMCLGSVSTAFAEEISQKDMEMANQLRGYGILQGDENNNLNLDKTITRAEMAVLVLRMLGYEDVAKTAAGTSMFSDVAADHWGNPYINYAANIGVIKGFDDGTFKPDEEVKTEQAMKMIVAALGYENVMTNIVYPDSYMKMAGQLKLMSGVEATVGEAALRGAVARMIYNSLDIAQIVRKDNGYFPDEDTTLRIKLEKHAGMTMYEGIVNATDAMNLYSTVPLEKKNAVKIDDEVYDAAESVDVDKFIGKNVQYFIKEDELSNKYIVDMVEKPGKNSEIVIDDTSSIEKFENNDVYYYETETKQKRIRLSEDYTVTLNGVQYSPLFDMDKFKSLDATIKFIDNDDDNEYEVILAEGTESYVVDKVVPASELIVLKFNQTYNGAKSIRCEISDIENGDITILDTEGNTVELKDIQPDDSLSIYPSSSGKLKMIVNSENIVASPESIASGNDEIKIDGKVYKVAPNAEMPSLSLSETYLFYLNSSGKIFYADEQSMSQTYYYVMDKYKDVNEEYLAVKLLSDDKQIVKLEFADKINIDGERYTDINEAYNLIKTGSVVNIMLDSENKIKRFDNSVAIQSNVASRIYTDEYNDDNERIRFDGTQIFTTTSNKPFAIDDNTAIFFVPTSENPSVTYDEKDYQENYTLKRKNAYMTQAFDFDPETQIAKAIVVEVHPETDEKIIISDKSPIGIISAVNEEVTETGELCVALTMIVDGEEVVNKVTEDSDVYDLARELGKGDVIRYMNSYSGYVSDIEKMFTPSEIEGYTYFHTGAGSAKERYFGKVKNVTLNYLSKASDVYVNQVVLLDDGAVADSFEFPTNTENVFRITSAKKNNVQYASFYDIKCADDLGVDEASSVFMYGNLTKPLFIVIID